MTDISNDKKNDVIQSPQKNFVLKRMETINESILSFEKR